MRSWIVYEHISPSGKVYVGITSRDPNLRWGAKGSNYLTKVKNKYVHKLLALAILKYGWDNMKHIILCKTTKERATLLEKALIRYYKNKKLSYNITDGGEGTLGVHFNHSEEAKLKIKLHHRHLQTEETRIKISKIQRGKKFSEKRKQILRDAHKHERIPVAQYSKNGELIRTFNSMMEAEREIGISSGNISSCIKHRIKTAGGFIWKLYNN